MQFPFGLVVTALITSVTSCQAVLVIG